MMVVENAGGRHPTTTKQQGGNGADNAADKEETAKQKKERNSGDILARRRFENIRKHSARTRHRTGIVNNGEKNRLTIAEKQLVKARRVAEARVHRIKVQLKRELHEMEAGRRALKRHSICVKDEDRDKDRQNLSKYCQRGRYLYAIRNDTKSQKEEMNSYNDRLEKASRMLQPARRMSNLAMDMGKLMGQAPSNSYLRVGRRISVVEAPPAAKLLAFADSDSEEEDDIEEVAKSIPVKIPLERKEIRARSLSTKTPPPFDVNQLRKEFGPEMRKALESLMMDDPNVMLAMPISRGTTRGTTREERRDIDGPTNGGRPDHLPKLDHLPKINNSSEAETKTHSEKKSDAQSLKLPPVQAEKSLVGRVQKTHKTPGAAKPVLSTVTES